MRCTLHIPTGYYIKYTVYFEIAILCKDPVSYVDGLRGRKLKFYKLPGETMPYPCTNEEFEEIYV